jgi:hypothetical protein
MYLFSTGTIYPNEKLISPFSAYAIKNHNGNYKEAAKDLYNQGYGSRIVTKKKAIEDKEIININADDLNFPIDIFPQDIQEYMIECNKTLDSSIDYMGCSMLWLLSVIVGNSIPSRNSIDLRLLYTERISHFNSLATSDGLPIFFQRVINS